MAEKPQTLNLALRKAWDSVANDLFHEAGADEVSGEVVCRFMRDRLNDLSPTDNSTIRRFWAPLTDEEKTQALQTAFPDPVSSRNA
jgi:hypothetical protein